MARLIEQHPAVVLIAGDFIYQPLDEEPDEALEEFERGEYTAEAAAEIQTVVKLLRPLAALVQVPDEAPRLVLMHHPDTFARLPAGTAPLAMAGHTHGGQVRLPFLPEWSWLSLTRGDEVHVDGWIHGYGQPGNRLYVNRGIGFSRVPIRLNCPPELTLFALRG